MRSTSLIGQVLEGVRLAYDLADRQKNRSFEEWLAYLYDMDVKDGGDRVTMFSAEVCADAVNGVRGNIFDLSANEQATILKAHQALLSAERLRDFAAHA